MSEVQLVNPEEFGIEQTRATNIVEKFNPLISEISAYTEQYNELIKSEITPDLCKKAKELRLKYRDIRTKKVNVIHKAEKDFYLAGGKFVDAWKNRLNTGIELREEKLFEIEDYYENIAREEIKKQDIQRKEELQKYAEVDHSKNYGEMDSEVWDAFINAKKEAYNKRIEEEKEAEAKRIEEERLNALENKRRLEIAPFTQFNSNIESLRLMSEESFSSLIQELKKAKSEYDKEQESIRLENEKLKKDAEKAEKERQEKDLKLRLEKEKLEKEAKAEIERLESEKRKIEQEKQLAEQAEIEKQQNLLKGNDQTKLKTWFADFENLKKSIPNFSSEYGKDIEKTIKEAFSILRAGIIEKSKSLK